MLTHLAQTRPALYILILFLYIIFGVLIMRKPFQRVFVSKNLHYSATIYKWTELGFGHKLELKQFFDDVISFKAKTFAANDNRDWRTFLKKHRAPYYEEAQQLMFARPNRKTRIDQALLEGCRFALPNIIRFFQRPKDIETGILGGLHFGVLTENGSTNILALSILDRNETPNTAEFSYWKHPTLSSKAALKSAKIYLMMGQELSGYKHFISHTEMKTEGQRGDESFLAFAKRLDFKEAGIREPNAPNGNGKYTHILKADGWQYTP